MIAIATDFRIPVMTWVQASWEEADGPPQTIAARMENKSAGGACIRIKTPIQVGLKLRIQWRFEQFSGTAKYCRKDGIEYLVGIQRDVVSNHAAPSSPAPALATDSQVARNAPPVSTSPAVSTLEKLDRKPAGIAIVERLDTDAAVLQPATSKVSESSKMPPDKVADKDSASRLQNRHSKAAAKIPIHSKLSAAEIKSERKPMRSKWLGLSSWGDKQNGPGESATENSTGQRGNQRSTRSNENFQQESVMSNGNQSSEKGQVHPTRQVPSFQVELLPMEDIYRAAGIMAPRKGYSITKVVEMLHSEHLREASNEMKRAALLTALDAAGIPLDQVQQDAKARQNALDSHEAEQREQVEAEWARKAEEVVQTQAELESIKAHYAARISRNLEGVAREKATFNSWLALKQQECQNMKEALELCLKAPAPDSSSIPSSGGSLAKAAGAGAKLDSTNGTIQ